MREIQVVVDGITTVYTKVDIRYLLATDWAVAKEALSVLYNRQTEQEQAIEQTVYQNTVGFNHSDSKSLTIIAKRFTEFGTISAEEIHLIHRRLPKYWAQVMDYMEDGK